VLRAAPSRGATLVEYGLVFSLVVVVGLAAMDAITESASKEIDNQAVCVSDRPPPDADGDTCRFAPVPEAIEYPDPDVIPPSWQPTDELPDIYTITASMKEEEVVGGVWYLRLPVSVYVEVQEPPVPAEGAGGIPVRARLRLNGTIEQYTECVTDDAGECTLEYPVTQADVNHVTMLVIDVGSEPPPEDFPPMVTFTR
jgi:hypothetical protein